MKLVIIGNGVAGVTTARLVAESDPSATVVIYSDEPFAYYPRPRLIEFLAGEVALEKMAFYPDEWYQKRNIRTLLDCPVREIRPAARQIVLTDDSVVGYDSLVLAMGARAWVPPIAGADLAQVRTLRNMHDALAIRSQAKRSAHAVILGGGLLGLDTSIALRANEMAVTVVEILPRLLPRQLDDRGAGLLTQMLEDRGVHVITNDSCRAIEGSNGCKRVSLKSGKTLDADLVIISAGVRSNTHLALEAGIACNHGVLVDERMSTNAPDVYAVGDVAEYAGRTWAIIPAALSQAKVAAAHICGDRQAIYRDIVPSTTLKVTGIDLTSIGEVNPVGGDFVEMRCFDASARVYKKLVVRNRRAVGAILLGSRSSLRFITRLVGDDADVETHRETLLQEGFDLSPLQKTG